MPVPIVADGTDKTTRDQLESLSRMRDARLFGDGWLGLILIMFTFFPTAMKTTLVNMRRDLDIENLLTWNGVRPYCISSEIQDW
jgi:hypothetical protein